MITTTLPPLTYSPPMSLEALEKGGPSRAGWSMVSAYLECPEKGRLLGMGVKPRRIVIADSAYSLTALSFGSFMHAARGLRISAWHAALGRGADPVGAGASAQFAAETYIEAFEGITDADRLKALNCLRVYDITYPIHLDRWIYLGVETEVASDIGGGVIRTVRYDAVVRPLDLTGAAAPTVTSLELKTSSRGGQSAMAAYQGQFATQVAIWNSNPALVEQYGRMSSVIPDIIVKTIVPQAERIDPFYIHELQQRRILEYLRLPEAIRYPVSADGTYPRMMHACQGRYGPCQFIGLCHHDLRGAYEFPEAA